MEQTIKIYCKNTDQTLEVPMGANLEEIYQLSGLKMEYGPISAHVNNKVEGMHYRAYKQKEVEFLDITSKRIACLHTQPLLRSLQGCTRALQALQGGHRHSRLQWLLC